MDKTQAFFIWFFRGLEGLGGWFLFFLLALAAVVWLMYDSSRRKLPALGWKSMVFLLAALILPSIIYRFASVETQLSLDPFVEAIFYLGMLGGILPVVLDIGYYVTYQGSVGCPKGHVYEARLGACPECAREAAAAMPPVVVQQPEPPRRREPARQPEPVVEPVKQVAKAAAWLRTSNGRTYQLNCGETTIGRGSDNDIQIDGDTAVSRHHARIKEANGHFRLFDVGSASGTRLNSKMLRQPTLLEANDEISIGENTTLIFISGQK